MDLQPLSTCAVDRTATLGGVLFQLGVLAGSGAGLALLSGRVEHLAARLGVMAMGVLIFELFTAPMWHNASLGRLAYLYRDVSWVLTLGWSVLFLLVVEVGDRLMPRWRAWRRFLGDVVVLTLLVVPLEWLVVRLGIRSYAPEVHDAAVGGWIDGVPVAVLYYVPVFTSLVLGFYRYWCLVIDDVLLIPMRRIRWGRGCCSLWRRCCCLS